MNSNNRNSRDDKSKSGEGSKGRRPSNTDKPKYSDSDDRGKRKAGFSANEKSSFKPRNNEGRDSKPFSNNSGGKDYKGKSSTGSFRPRNSEEGGPRSSSNNSTGKDYKGKNESGSFRPRTERDGNSSSYRPKTDNKENSKPWEKRESSSPGYKTGAYKEGSSRKEPSEGKRSYIKKDNFITDGDKSRFANKGNSTSRNSDSRPYRKRDSEFKKEDRGERVAPYTRSRKVAEPKDDGLIRLNRYIANSGICSRRKADELIEAGVVSVNNKPVTELGHKVDPYKDEVRYNGELLKREKKVYVLLNKPKDYITTTDDPQERKTVMQLVEKASRERIYPVGRLDRNTTGLILMTNDGDLADKLSHPRNGITKIYHVELSKNLSQGDFNKIQFGLELEDGLIKPDNISYVAGASKKEIGIQIHSGKNRIVRRIFEHLGYDVVKLDRVVYGNLTKKDLPRGKWRFLEEHELIQIKHLIK